jgi:hypothetical protein
MCSKALTVQTDANGKMRNLQARSRLTNRQPFSNNSRDTFCVFFQVDRLLNELLRTKLRRVLDVRRI